MAMEVRRLRERTEQKRRHEHEQGKNDAYKRPLECRCVCRIGRLAGELSRHDLHAVLQVDPRDVESKGITGEESDVTQEVADYET